MIPDWTPMRWPAAWKSASALELLEGTPINYLIGADAAIATQAEKSGLTVLQKEAKPEGIAVFEGIWPGIKIARFGALNAVSAGPTGAPWVDSNFWPVRLARARQPETPVWIRTKPDAQQGGAALPYIVAIADAALGGARWIIQLDETLAAAIAGRQPAALAIWQRIASTAGYFAARRAWTDYVPEAVVGVLSDFATAADEELLNLITRSGQQYRVIPNAIPNERFDPAALAGLRAIVLPGKDAPPPPIRAALMVFVSKGGLLIAGDAWGATPGAAPKDATHPRFTLFTLGSGSIAIAKTGQTDPYMLAEDSAILVSHRYDILRFWNGGAMTAYYSAAPDRRRALLQILFYADQPPEDASVRIAGAWRSARLSTLAQPGPQPVHTEQQEGAIEIHLPRVAQFAAIELEA